MQVEQEGEEEKGGSRRVSCLACAKAAAPVFQNRAPEYIAA